MYKKRHYDTYITEEKPTSIINCLQSLQGRLCGTHLRISILILLREWVSFNFAGTIPKILDPK